MQNFKQCKAFTSYFRKVDGYVGKYDITKCLALFYSEKYERIFNRIRYLKKQCNIRLLS